jgi:hypothetical protein
LNPQSEPAEGKLLTLGQALILLHCSNNFGSAEEKGDMKKVLIVLVAVAFAASCVSAAHAGTIKLASYGNQGPALLGADNSALGFLGYDPSTPIVTGLGNDPTYNLPGNVSPWADPIAGSRWVSQDSLSDVILGDAPPNGYYSFTTIFNATPGTYNGSLGIYADDTAEVFLNGILIAAFDTNTVNGPCAQDHNGPTCIGDPFQAMFTATLGSTNVLTFVDWQSGGSAEGLDFQGTLTPVPEPGSLLLLGSGLASLAGFLYRKAKATV